MERGDLFSAPGVVAIVAYWLCIISSRALTWMKAIAACHVDQNYNVSVRKGLGPLLLYSGINVAPACDTHDEVVGRGRAKTGARK